MPPINLLKKVSKIHILIGFLSFSHAKSRQLSKCAIFMMKLANFSTVFAQNKIFQPAESTLATQWGSLSKWWFKMSLIPNLLTLQLYFGHFECWKFDNHFFPKFVRKIVKKSPLWGGSRYQIFTKIYSLLNSL